MVASIEIWDDGFNLFEVSQDTDTVSAHTGTTVDIATAPWTPNQWIGYSIKFTDGALDDNGYVITGNDTNTITCSAADFSSLANGESFKIITTGKALSSVGAPVDEISLGWTGKIIGITNSAKIIGISVTSIVKVTGIE